jgi:ElaB/YqjD/DUF883 family membrane-anchored ribosome-binding protein
MNIYEKTFKRQLNEADGGPVNVSPQPQGETPSDADVWASQNTALKDKGLEGKFNVEDIPKDVRDQYTTKIDSWRKEISNMSDTLEQVYDFASSTAEKAGADKIFAETSDVVEDLLTNIGTLQGKLKFLSKKVMVAMDRDNKKQRGM